MSILHINWTQYSSIYCAVNYCPTCKRLRRMACKFQEWYGAAVTCAGCGEQWTDGEMLDRPFAPGWRKKNIEQARKQLAGIGINA